MLTNSTLAPKKRGRPRKNAQNPAPPTSTTVPTPRIVPRAASLVIEDAQAIVYKEAAQHAHEAVLMFVEAVQQARGDMASGKPITRQGIEAGKVLLGILDAKTGDAPSRPMAEWSIAELEDFVVSEAAKRGNAAKDVTPSKEVSDMFD